MKGHCAHPFPCCVGLWVCAWVCVCRILLMHEYIGTRLSVLACMHVYVGEGGEGGKKEVGWILELVSCREG